MSTPTPKATISKERFAEILTKIRERKQEASILIPTLDPATDLEVKWIPSIPANEESSNLTTTDKYGNEITYNDKQQEAINLIASGKDCIVIGPAGTGKTTCMKGGVSVLTRSVRSRILQAHDHKHLPHGVPGIIICAYTRRATNNIRRNVDEAMKGNCITIHKTIEYAPEYYTIIDKNGEEKNTMRFVPTRHAMNPLPAEVFAIVFEESSMIGTELYNEVIDALPPKVQQIFLGDIQQLPPVFGSAILGYKMLELPVVELTEVYRQALESPIIRLAHRILSGNPIPETELPSWKFPGQLKITPWKKPIPWESALSVSENLFAKLFEDGSYDPEEDMILMPFNKSYGTVELNKSIANHLARKRVSVVWEVIAGFVKHYLSVGDKVLFDREDALVLDIFPNPAYTGVQPQKESTYLDYWGHDNSPKDMIRERALSSSGEDIDFLLAQVASDDEERVTQSSHHIKLKMLDSDTEKTITKAAEVNALLLGYCLTVHKAQGSEWDKVFLLIHNSHATMVQRELLYTAVTRAKKELFVICEPDTFVKGITSQRIRGNTLAEKAEFFKGKIDRKDAQS